MICAYNVWHVWKFAGRDGRYATEIQLWCYHAYATYLFFLYYRYLHEPNSPKKKITRKREFEDSIREENIEMPTQLPPEVERKSIQERIQVWSLSTLCTCDWIYAKYSWSCNSFIFVNFYPCWIITSIKCWTCNFCHNC